VGDGIAEGADLKAIGQCTKGRGMTGFPRLAETDDADAKFHGEDAGC
jgi:hypothetical protein